MFTLFIRPEPFARNNAVDIYPCFAATFNFVSVDSIFNTKNVTLTTKKKGEMAYDLVLEELSFELWKCELKIIILFIFEGGKGGGR